MKESGIAMTIPREPDPFRLFGAWLEEAEACTALAQPTAMTLATVDDDTQPWPRVVLLKGFDEGGFTFYTNLGSIKAAHLKLNPRAGLCFYWMPLDKQVRILGSVEPVSDDEADAYFATRPRESQVGAWASEQSHTLASRAELERRFAEFSAKFEGGDVPRPPFWSGYRLAPHLIEFWLAQPYRLHERLLFTRDGAGTWQSELLYP